MKALNGSEVAALVEEKIGDALVESAETCIVVRKVAIPDVMSLLKDIPDLDFDYLNDVTAVDRLDHFEVIYNLTSTGKKHTICVKARIPGRENPELPSVTSIWRGADFQEREVYDMMGIRFTGHPNLKRIALWEGFEGYPLRRDFL